MIPQIKLNPNNLDKKNIPKQLLVLNTNPVSSTAEGDIKENLYGKFFYDRAEFYIIKNPKNKKHSSSIESITLVYLDDNLFKTKYSLSSNIVEELIEKYGVYEISGYDFDNRGLISTEKVMIEKNGAMMLNKKLDNYQLTWQLETKEIIYRVNSRLEEAIFEFTERRKDYKNRFRDIEYTYR